MWWSQGLSGDDAAKVSRLVGHHLNGALSLAEMDGQLSWYARICARELIHETKEYIAECNA